MAKEKILLIDDEEDIREIIKLHLGEQKYQILEAENGEEAIQLLRSEAAMVNVGAILCDIRMPKVNGIECVDYLQREAPGIPVVVITGYPDTNLEARLRGNGIKDYLIKPVEKKKLLDIVEKVIACDKAIKF